MKRLILFAMLALAGCETSSEEAAQATSQDQSTTLTGDYLAVSDCFHRNAPRGYRKTDDPSARTSTVEGTSASGSSEKIEFIGAGDGVTKVQAHLEAPGADVAWRGNMSILKQCAESSIAQQ